jgi:hypothetical protein
MLLNSDVHIVVVIVGFHSCGLVMLDCRGRYVTMRSEGFVTGGGFSMEETPSIFPQLFSTELVLIHLTADR